MFETRRIERLSKMKKILMSIILSAVLIMSGSNSAFANVVIDIPEMLVTAPATEEELEMLGTFSEVAREEPVSIYRDGIVLYVTSPCDEEWRATYPTDWMYVANQAIEHADDFMYDRFGIDLYSNGWVQWDSNDSISAANNALLLAEVMSEHSLINGCNIMIAFSGQAFIVAGVSIPNGVNSLIMDQGLNANKCVVRHEVGHLFGCPDHITSTVCLMYNSYTYYSSICSSCQQTWYANRNTK